MESNNWRPAQGEPPSMEVPSSDWRSQLQSEERQRIVNKIMDTLSSHLPVAVPEGMSELKKIAVRFEEKIYTAAVNQSDYLRKISLKMLSMETKTQQNTPMNPQAGVNQNSTDTASADSTAQTGHNNADWQEEIYQKTQACELLAEEGLTPEEGNIEANERVFTQIMSPKHPGRVRTQGFGVTSTRYFPHSTHNIGEGSGSDNFARVSRVENEVRALRSEVQEMRDFMRQYHAQYPSPGGSQTGGNGQSSNE